MSVSSLGCKAIVFIPFLSFRVDNNIKNDERANNVAVVRA